MTRYGVLRENKSQWSVRDMITGDTVLIFTTRNGATAHARRLNALNP